MTKKLILACAGAGKTHRIVQESIEKISDGGKVLVITYTQNNQFEIVKRFNELNRGSSRQFVVKGLFTFLIEDMIRPYQKCIFNDRISTINFNRNGDPNKRKGRAIPGTAEKTRDGSYNYRHFLTSCRTKAHTTYLSKLACRIIRESRKKPIARLEAIYTHLYFDEVQDLVGWDYELLKQLSTSRQLNVTCVGDFRQTIYQTATTTKQPRTNEQKMASFRALDFDIEPLQVNRRSIQSICDFADSVHAREGYEATQSLVETVSCEYQNHLGVYIIKKSDVKAFTELFSPVLLRSTVRSGKGISHLFTTKFNFGQAKGLGFDRVLILPTKAFKDFLSGDKNAFRGQKTDAARNKLYVAITRARYSVGFVIEDDEAEKYELPLWTNE